MTDYTQNTHDKQTGDSNDTLAALLNLAGPNAEISSEVEQRVYASVRSEWRRRNSMSRGLRWALPFAIAASVLIALTLKDSDTIPQAAPVAAVTLVANEAGVADHAVGDAVYAGDVVDTSGDTGMSLALRGDISLRIDRDTLLKFDSTDELTLMAGRVYIDTGDRIYADRHITVHTQSGTATDVGTQFSVKFENADMSVAVREGRVDLDEGRRTHTAVRGDKVTVRPGQVAQFESVPIVGEHWDWAVSLAPSFEIEDRSLLDFLKWVSRETGMQLVFVNDDVRMEAMRPRLHGSVEGMTPLEAVEAVMATTQFTYSIDDDTLTISK